MTTQNPAEPLSPPSTPPSAELSPIGLLCDGILAMLNAEPGIPERAKLTIGTRIGDILGMFSEAKTEVQAAQKRIRDLRKDVRALKERLAVLNQEHFGASSERSLDSEADLGFGDEDPDEEDEQEEEVKAKGKGARKIPKDIEVVRVDHYPEDMTCCTCGCQMKSIKAEERVGSFRIVPEHVVVVKDVYHTCACNRGICKENGPVTAKATKFIMRGRGVETGLIIEAAAQKFFESTAIYRMERRFANNNIDLPRQTIGRNLAHVSRFLRPVGEALLEHIRSGSVVHMDETPLRIQAPGTGKSDTGYLWAICRDERRWNPDTHPAVYYEYAPTRAGEVAERLLTGSLIEYLQTDGYAGYNRLFKTDGTNHPMTSVRCWAHARRKFHEALKATGSSLAGRVRSKIKKLYKIEKTASGLPAEARLAIRQEQSLPILDDIRADLLRAEDQAHGELKKAINYTLNAFDALRCFVFDGRLEIDNNPIERCMRLIALAKKNSIGAGSHEAAKVWAIFYTLIESARLNRVNPRAYLNWVVEEIERSGGEIDHGLLMPWHCPVGRLDD
ncbi:IS66 family transposase [Paenirhodobacter populi]|uniref:IS66 family transposase n=1 Tax=Paenirhodobacter populi TaxID=2306993 RepID=A0A443IK68_9RHOB|nr:IS66 family transposase [Sinirhodobacter populi]RWR05294.1 IS66 family transposase [Sinirhodobacter populi]